MTLRKVTKNRSLFPNDEVVFKLMRLALRNISERRTTPIKNRSGAMSQFAIPFEGRAPTGGLNSNTHRIFEPFRARNQQAHPAQPVCRPGLAGAANRPATVLARLAVRLVEMSSHGKVKGRRHLSPGGL